MLTTIREKVKGWIAWVIVILIVIPFALFGINQYFIGGSDVIVAEVGDKEITKDDFTREYESQKRRLQEQLGKNYNADVDKNLKSSVLSKVVSRALMEQAAEYLNLTTTNQELQKYIEGASDFHQDGVFSIERYEQVLRLINYSVQRFEQDQKKSLTINQLNNLIVNTAFSSNFELENLNKLRNQERKFAYLLIDANDYIDSAEVDEQSIIDAYEENKTQFVEPQKIKIEYVKLSIDDLINNIAKADEDTLLNIYENEKDRFITEEERRAKHILLSDKKTALDLLAKLKSGSDFDTLAKDYSEDSDSKENGGDLGFFVKGVMIEEIEDVVFSLNVGDISDVIKTEFGYHIIKLTDILNEKTKSFIEVKKDIEDIYKNNEAAKKLIEISEVMANLAYENPDALIEVANEVKQPILETNWFSINGATQGIVSNPIFLETAFSDTVLNKGENSEVIELDKNTIAVMRLKELEKQRQKSFDETKDFIKNRLALLLSSKYVKELGENIAELLKAKDSKAAKLIKDNKLKWRSSDWVNRFNDELKLEIIRLAFATKKPVAGDNSYFGVNINESSYAIIKLIEVRDGKDTSTNEERQSFYQSWIKAKENEAFISILKTLQENTEINIFNDRI